MWMAGAWDEGSSQGWALPGWAHSRQKERVVSALRVKGRAQQKWRLSQGRTGDRVSCAQVVTRNPPAPNITYPAGNCFPISHPLINRMVYSFPSPFIQWPKPIIKPSCMTPPLLHTPSPILSPPLPTFHFPWKAPSLLRLHCQVLAGFSC